MVQVVLNGWVAPTRVHPSQERLCSRPCSTRLYEHSESPHSIPHPDPITEHHTLLVIRALVLSVCRYSPTPNTVHCTRSVRYAWVPPSPRAPTALRCHLACTVWFTCLHTPPPSPSNSPTAIQGVLPRCVGSLVSYNSLSPPPRPGERRPPSHETARVTERGPVPVTVTMAGGNRVAGVFRLHRFSATADFVASSPPSPLALPNLGRRNQSVCDNATVDHCLSARHAPCQPPPGARLLRPACLRTMVLTEAPASLRVCRPSSTQPPGPLFRLSRHAEGGQEGGG